MNIRKAKKILKKRKSHLHPDKPLYTEITWLKKKKVFRVLDYYGQVILTYL